MDLWMGATCHSGTSPEMYREPLRVIILNELIESFPNYKFRDIIVEKYRPALLEISCTIITEEGKVFELTFYLSKRRCMSSRHLLSTLRKELLEKFESINRGLPSGTKRI